MKKIISFIILSLFFILSCQNGLPENEGRMYVMHSTDNYIGGSLEIYTYFELSENRVNNFYDTLKIIFENSSNFGDIDYSFKLSFETENHYMFLFSSDEYSLDVIENNNFDDSITDSKNLNYYMMSVELTAHIPPTENTEQCNLHLRKLEPVNNKQTIAVMVEQKRSSGTYEYLADFVLEGIEILPHFGSAQATPDFLK